MIAPVGSSALRSSGDLYGLVGCPQQRPADQRRHHQLLAQPPGTADARERRRGQADETDDSDSGNDKRDQGDRGRQSCEAIGAERHAEAARAFIVETKQGQRPHHEEDRQCRAADAWQQPQCRRPVLLAQRTGAPDEQAGQPFMPQHNEGSADSAGIETDDKPRQHDRKR